MALPFTAQAIADKASKELGIKHTRCLAKAELYLKTVQQELVKQYCLAPSERKTEQRLCFAMDTKPETLGKYKNPESEGPKQKYWWYWLVKNFPLYTPEKQGNNIQGKLTMVHSHLSFAQAMDMNDAHLLEALDITAPDTDSHDWVPIDAQSLEAYVNWAMSKTSNSTLVNNMHTAELILRVSQAHGGYLPQKRKESVFGRLYYTGLNLQQCHKSVREAALGECVNVDIRSSVFAWKLSMMPNTEPYINTREFLRPPAKKRILRDLALVTWGNADPHSIKSIKQVLTAISFGARENTLGYWTHNGEWCSGAISSIIKSEDRKRALLQDPWMRDFLKEQNQINSVISSTLKNALSDGDIPQDIDSECRTAKGRLSMNKLMAWAYQQYERRVMQHITSAKVAGAAELLLWVHDGVYYRKSPDVASMNSELQTIWSYGSVEAEELTAWHYTTEQERRDTRMTEMSHKQRIAQEEERAQARAINTLQ